MNNHEVKIINNPQELKNKIDEFELVKKDFLKKWGDFSRELMDVTLVNPMPEVFRLNNNIKLDIWFCDYGYPDAYQPYKSW